MNTRALLSFCSLWLAFAFVLSFSACRPPATLTLPSCSKKNLFEEPTMPENCPIGSQPSKQCFEKFEKDGKTVRGCLLLFWNNDTNIFRAVNLNLETGVIRNRTETSETEFSIDIPAENRENTFLFRMYLMHPALTDDTNFTLAEHNSLCRIMGSASYDCFSQENINSGRCWLALSFSPSVTPDGLKVFPVDSGDNQNCNLCAPEVCGDDKDSNCNGENNEFDEAAGRVACN